MTEKGRSKEQKLSRTSSIPEADKFRMIVENTPLLVSTVALTPEPIITYASLSHKAVLGYEPGDLVGKPLLSFAHKKDVPELQRILQAQLAMLAASGKELVLDDFKANIETRIRHSDGSYRLMEIVVRGLGQELLLASHDITEQREALHILIDSEERFRLLFENAPEAYYILDAEGKFVDGNRAAEAMIGTSRDDFIGKSFFKAGLLHPKHYPRAAAHLARNLMGHRAGPDELLLKQKGGKWINIEVTTFPVNFKAKKLVLGIARDISHRKEQESLLRQARLRAEEASRAKSSFLAGMSHELRTPLNAVIGFSEILLDKQMGDLNESQEEYVRDIHESGRHLLNLINEVLDLAKVESGTMELQRAPVSVGATCNDSLVMVRQKALSHGINLQCKVDEMPQSLSLDERKLKQVLFNLLSNAVKFTPDRGTVTMRARLEAEAPQSSAGSAPGRPTPDFPPEVQRRWLVVEVEDSGIGIEPTLIETLFDPFEQIDGAAVDGTVGTGLGLPLSRSIAELHGGTLNGFSEGQGKGARFTAILPTWECEEDLVD